MQPTLDLDTAPDVMERFDEQASIVLYEGNNLDLVSQIPTETVQLIVTSPPYNIGKDYETRVAIDKYLAVQQTLIGELHRILAPTGSICWQVGNYVEDSEVFPLDILFYDAFKSLGMKLRNRIVWHFGHGLHARKRFSGRYETILWFTKGDDYTFNLDSVRVPSKYPGKRHFKGPNKGKPSGNPKGKNPSDIWEIVVQDWGTGLWNIPNCKANHPEKTIHPAQFPVELVERCVLALSDERDWVYDPYAGAGSALIAAVKHGRRAMGSEQAREYVSVAKARLRDYYAGVLPLRAIGTPVWTPSGNEKVARVPEEWETVEN